MKKLLLLILLGSSGCTTAYYPDGKKFVSVSSNFKGRISGPGMVLDGEINNAIVIQKVGAGVTQGIMSATIPAMTGGVIK